MIKGEYNTALILFDFDVLFVVHPAQEQLSVYGVRTRPHRTGHFPEMMAGGPGVAPSYVNLESTRSHFDPPPAAFTSHLNI
jgi:hypothetical protein